MFKDIFLFEIRYRIKRPATYLYFLFLFLMVFFATVSNSVTIGEQAGNLLRNSPSAIFRIISTMSAFSVLIVSAIMSTPVLRDFEHNTYHLLYSYPMKKFAYLAGRFLGSYVFALFVLLSLPLGIIVGSAIAPVAGWIEASRFDSFRLTAYLSPFLIVVIPSTFFTAAIFFSLTSLNRRMIYWYLGSVLLLVFYVWAVTQLTKLDSKFLASILDPFAIASFYINTEYWTPAEINTLLVPFTNSLLINRILWTSVGVLILAFTFFRFKLITVFEKKSKKAKRIQIAEEGRAVAINLPKVSQTHSVAKHFRQMFSQGWLEFISTIKEVPFIGIVVAGVMLLLTNAVTIGEMYGTNTFPVTYNLLDFTSGNFALIIYIIITFYSGEIIWRERGYGINQITDSLPLPSWLFAGSKLWAMFLILVMLQFILMVVNILTQIYHGFYDFNIPLYLTELFTLQLPGYFMIAVLAMLIQTFASNKYVGHVIVMFYYIILFIAMGLMGVEHYLWRFPQTPPSTYSDMNGFGHLLTGVRWYQLAWLFLSVAMVSIMILCWSRGYTLSFLNRIKVSQNKFKGASRNVLLISIL